MAASASKIKTGFDLLVLIIFTWCALYPILFLVSNYYEEVLNVMFAQHYRPRLESLLLQDKFKIAFKLLKIGLFFIIAWIVSIWFDYFTSKKKWFTSFLTDQISNTLYKSFNANKHFLSALQKETKVALFLSLFILTAGFYYFMIHTPISYDELFSYRNFSGPGIWTSLSYYPVPNNHVFYNIVSSFFIELPLDAEIAVRIPSLLASVITVYYFFKLCRTQFNESIAVIITLFIICLFPFQLFSISARGYAFINLFTVLLVYSLIKLKAEANQKKYRYLFILSGFLGLFSIPSFLYVLFPVYSVYFIYVLYKKQKAVSVALIKAGFITVCLSCLSYSFILFLNKPSNLLNPNGGATKFSLSDPGSFSLIVNHMKEISLYLFFNEYTLFLLIILVLIFVAYAVWKKTTRNLFLPVLALCMLLSPLIILPLHRVLPFQRTWLYLIFPMAVCIGYVIDVINNTITITLIPRYNLNIYIIALALLFFSFTRFDIKHKKESNIDYEIADIRKDYINAQLTTISDIALTTKSMEYYPAEFIWNLCYKIDHNRRVKLAVLDTIINQDILVINNSETERFNAGLLNYTLLKKFNENISVYYKTKH